MTIMNCVDGMVYETISYSFPGVAEIFMLTSEKGTEIMAAVADFTSKSIKSGSASNHLVIEDVFVMVPVSYDDLAFVLPLTESERTLKDYEKDLLSEDAESPWEEKPYSESIKGEDHLKYYFLSPNHH